MGQLHGVLPERSLPPSLLVPHDVDNFPADLVIPLLLGRGVDHDEGTALDPEGRPEACWQLDQHLFLVGQLNEVNVVAGSLDCSCDLMSAGEFVRREHGFLGRSQYLATRRGHFQDNLSI